MAITVNKIKYNRAHDEQELSMGNNIPWDRWLVESSVSISDVESYEPAFFNYRGANTVECVRIHFKNGKHIFVFNTYAEIVDMINADGMAPEEILTQIDARFRVLEDKVDMIMNKLSM
jgi:hypothetical protein